MNNTLKLGSRGDDVKTLQRLLGITADGIFGKQTESAVIAYQRKNGLVADGIVGAKTWIALQSQPQSDGDVRIVPAYIYNHIRRLPNRAVKYIAIHYTAGTTSKAGTAVGVSNLFQHNPRPASADFVVDDATIVQCNPDIDNYYCFSVGDKYNKYSGGGQLYGTATNRNTVSIEICSNMKAGMPRDAAKYANHGGWYFTEASLDNALKLVRYLMKKHGVPKERVVRHYDVSGKVCPGIIGWNDCTTYTFNGTATNVRSTSDDWKKFWNKI